jgi:hypothetical protein
MAFAPRIRPEDFKAAFTSADGWGSFWQKYRGDGLDASITLAYGKLSLASLALQLPKENKSPHVVVTVAGKPVPASATVFGSRILISFPSRVSIPAEQALKVMVD